MKRVAVLLVLAFALLLNGCSSQTDPQSSATGVWQADLLGGEGTATGFSFIVQFSVEGNNALSFSNFQFLNNVSGGCFPVLPTGSTLDGTLNITANSADQVSGTFSMTVAANGNTLTLTSTTVSGTENTNDTALTGGSITGTWTLTGSGSGCPSTSGTFTMTQSS
jgi:hypothetical protein